MKTTNINLVMCFFALISLTSCADLVVNELEVHWDETNKAATVEIANIGNRDAGNFMVYFNADENPISPNHRPQVRHNIPGLQRGESLTLTADFGPLAHRDNNNLGNVHQITVLVDPKGMVKEWKEDNNSKTAALGSGGDTACVDFGPPPAAGTEYGNPVGNTPGDVVLIDPNGIEMAVYEFERSGGSTTFNSGDIELPPVAFGTGQTLRANNINFEFDFTNVGFPVSKVEFDFIDLGGFENLSVNGQPAPIYAGELSAAPSPIGGVNVAVVITSVSGNNKKGKVTLTGAINRIRIGGQELWIDNICASK